MKKDLQETIQKTWTEAKQALQGIEEDIGRRFRQTFQQADLIHQSEEVQRILTDLGRQLQQSGDVLEKHVQEKLQTVFARVREPLFAELAFLKNQAEQLGQRIESQLKGDKGTKVDATDDSSDPDPDA